MARKFVYSANSLYFCGVKIYERLEVAAKSSVFRAHTLLEEIYPNDGGSSNARKGLARRTLTHRIGVLLCQNFIL